MGYRMPAKLSVGSLNISLRDLCAVPDLLIDEVRISSGRVVFDPVSGKFEAQEGRAEVEVSEGRLLLLVQTLVPSNRVTDLELRIAPDGVVIRGRYSLLVIGVPFEVRGALRIEDGVRLRFDVLSAKPAQGLLTSQLEARNPILDLSQMQLPVQLRLLAVRLGNGFVTLEGSVK